MVQSSALEIFSALLFQPLGQWWIDRVHRDTDDRFKLHCLTLFTQTFPRQKSICVLHLLYCDQQFHKMSPVYVDLYYTNLYLLQHISQLTINNNNNMTSVTKHTVWFKEVWSNTHAFSPWHNSYLLMWPFIHMSLTLLLSLIIQRTFRSWCLRSRCAETGPSEAGLSPHNSADVPSHN